MNTQSSESAPDYDEAMKRMAVVAIIAWAIVGTAILGSPVLLVYIAFHACVTGVFLFFFLRKEQQAVNSAPASLPARTNKEEAQSESSTTGTLVTGQN